MDASDFDTLTAPTQQPVQSTSNPFWAGIKSGALGAAGSIEGAVGAGAQLVGFGNDNAFSQAAQGFNQAAQAEGRPDLEQQGWTGGGLTGALKYGAYRAGQFIPQAAGLIASSALLAPVLPEAAAGGVLARLGMAAPEFLGGAGGAVGEAAEATGARFAKNLLAGGIPMAASSVGDIYNDANSRPGGASYGDVVKALALGIPVGMIQAIGPHGADGIVRSGLAHAGAFAVGAGLQEAATSTNDPNMTAGERAQAIVEAAAGGAVFGGLFGAGHGFFSPRAETGALSQQVDQQLAQPSAPSGIENLSNMGFEPGQQPTGQPDFMRPQLEPYQGQLDLLPIYRGAEATAPGGQGDLFNPSTLGQAPPVVIPGDLAAGIPDRRAQMSTPALPGGPELDPLYAARLQALGVDPSAPTPAVRDLAALTASMAESRVRAASPDLQSIAERLGRRGPIEAAEPTLTPAQDEALKSMGVEQPDQAAQPTLLDHALKVAEQSGNQGAVDAIKRVQESLTDKARGLTSEQIDAGAGPAQGEGAPRTIAQQEDDAARQRDLERLRVLAPDAAARRGLVDTPQPMPSAGDAAKLNVFQQYGDVDGAIRPGTKMRDWIDNSKVTSPPELYNALADEMAAKSPLSRTPTFKNMAEQIGLLGEDKKPFDFDAERQEAAEMPNEAARNARLAEIDQIATLKSQADALREPVEPRQVGPVDKHDFGKLNSLVFQGNMTDDEVAALKADYDRRDAERVARNANRPKQVSGLRMTPEQVQAELAASGSEDTQTKLGDILNSKVMSGEYMTPFSERMEARARGDRSSVPVAPKSIADRVMDIAHKLTGGTGGEAKISDIRAALPDVASGDLDNALRQIHGDDSDNVLTQAPKGARKGIDGVSVPQQGRFHNLSVEPREAEVAPSQLEQDMQSLRDANSRVGSRSDGTRLHNLKAAVPDMPKDRFDAALLAMRQSREVNLMNLDNPRDINAVRDDGGEVIRGDQKFHTAWFGDRPNAVQESSTTRVGAEERPGAVRTNGGGDQATGAVARAQSDAQRAQVGEAPRPAETQTSVGQKIGGIGPNASAAMDAAREMMQRRADRQAPVAKSREYKQILEAMKGATRNQDGVSVGLDNLRGRLATMSRAEVDKGLREHLIDPDSRLALLRHDDPRQITPEMEKAAFNPNGEPFHVAMTRPESKVVKPNEAYPGASEAAERLGVREPQRPIGVQRQAFDDKMQQLWSRAQKGDFGYDYAQTWRQADEYARQEGGGKEPTRAPVTPTGERIDMGQAFEAKKRLEAGVDQRGATTLSPETIGGTEAEAADALSIPPETIPPQADRPVMLKQAYDSTPIDNLRLKPETYDRTTQAADLKDVTSSLKPEYAARIKLLDNASQLPQELRDAAKRSGVDFNQPGFYIPAMAHMRDVYLFGDHIKSRSDLEGLVSHEVIGHVGTYEQVKGSADAYTNTLSKIFDRAGGKDGILKLMDKYKMKDNIKSYPWFQTDRPLTPMEKSMVVDEMFAHAAESTVFNRSQRGAMVILGRMKQAIVDMLRSAGLNDFADRFATFDVPEVEKWLADSRELLQGPQPENTVDLASLPGIRQDLLRLGEKGPVLTKLASLRDQNVVTGDVMRMVGGLFNKIKETRLGEVPEKVRSIVDNVKQTNDMVREWGKDVPAMSKDYHANELSAQVQAVSRQTTNVVERYLTQLNADDPQKIERLAEIMQNANMHGYDPFTRAVDQPHLRDASDEVKAQHAKDHAEVNSWNQPLKSNARGLFKPTEKNLEPGAMTQLYNMVKDAGEFVRNGLNVNRLQATAQSMGLKIAGFENHAVKDFVNQRELHGDVAGSRVYMRAALDKLVSATDAHLQTMEPGVARDAMSKLVDQVKTELVDQDRNIPYVHFGRDGDHFVSLTLAENDAGTGADAAKAQKLQDWLKTNDMGDVRVNTVQGNRDVMIRMDTEGARKKLAEAIKNGELKDITDPSVEPRNGVIESSKTEQPNLLPIVAQLRDRLSREFGADQKASILQTINHLMLDMAPQDSALGLNAQKMFVRGQSADLLKNFQHSNAIALNALGHGATMIDRANADAAMVKQRHDMTAQSHPLNYKVTELSRAIDSFRARNDAQSTRVQSNVVGTMRNAAHAFYLAGSPAYMVMQVAQPYTLTMPRLAMHYSYGGSMKALATALPEVARVMKAAASVHADILRGKGNTFSTGVTTEALRRYVANGGKQDIADFLGKLDSMGKLESGSMSYDNLADGNKHIALGIAKKAYQTAVSTATYAELGGRLVAGLAAKKLYDAAPEKARGFTSAEQYAAHIVSESMMEWGGAARSRLASPGGPLGPAAPVMLQFHGFGTQLYSQIMQATSQAIYGVGHYDLTTEEGRAEQAADKREARRFLLGHTAASMALAGSLGLPFAGWAAAAATKASTLIPGSGGEAYDVDAHYRDFLASIMGPKLGEVFAHGLPRFINSDFSDLGDKDLLPMQSFLEDRRKLEDSIPDYLSKSWGSSLGIATGALMGVRDLSEGRILPGLSRFMPTALRNFAKAYQLGTRGYLDSQGRAMPIDASALDVLKQAVGINSGARAEDEEKSNSIIGRNNDRTFHSGLIKQQLARAIESGDQAGVQRWTTEMQKYDADPAHAGQPIAATLQNYLAARQRAVQYSKVTGMPLATNMHDLTAPGLVNY